MNLVCRILTLFDSPLKEQKEDIHMLTFLSLLDQGKSFPSHDYHMIMVYSTHRNCIGQEFALNEERVVLAIILRHFEFFLDETKTVTKRFPGHSQTKEWPLS